MRVSRGIALLLVIGAAVLTGCNEPEISTSARCIGEPFVEGEAPVDPQRSLVLVDLSNNSAAGRQTIIDSLHPIVDAAVREGGVIRLVVSGGSGRPLDVSSCLDGKTVLLSDYNNPETEENKQEMAIEAIEGNVSALLEETRVSARGDVTNLLATIPSHLSELQAPAAAGARPVRVVLISDLISPLQRGDCMRLDGVPATSRAASQVVAACIRYRQFRPLPEGVELRVVRPQLTPGDSNANRLGQFLASSLCKQVTGKEGSCLGPEA
jgi:hypothetical protein